MIHNNYLLNIDVLGFGDFVKANSTRTVFDYYGKIITGANFAGSIVDEDKIDVMVYSDTIAMKSNNEDEAMCLVSLVRIANIIQIGQYYSALSQEAVFLPVRGTITFGEFVFHKGDIWAQALGRPKIYARNVDMIIGKPIVESYEFEKDIELMCVALGRSTVERAALGLVQALLHQNLLIEYDIPLKNGSTANGTIVNPVCTPHIDLNLRKLEHEASKHKDGSSTKAKYLNTIKLFEFIRTTRKFSPRLSE